MGLTTKEIGSSSFNDMISSVDRRSEYVENRAGANVRLNNFLTPYTLDNKSSILNAPCGYSNGTYASLRPIKTIGDEILSQPVDIDTDFNANAGGVIVDANTFTTAGGTFDGIIGYSMLVVGKKYRLEIQGSTTSSGFTIGNGGASGNEYGIGFGAHYFTAANVNLWIRQTTAGTTNITTFSIKEVTDADFDFSRGSSATRVNEQGLIEDVQILSGNLVQNGDFEQIGSELVTNGNFDTDLNGWTNYGGSLITWESGGYAAVSNNSGYWCMIRQNNVFEIGKIYKITMIAKSSLANRNFHGSFFAGQSFSEVDTFQTFTQYFKATGTDLNFGFSNVTGFGEVIMTVDNVSVKEVGQNWSFGTGWSMGDGKASSDGSANNSLLQIISFNPSILKINFEVSDLTQGSVRLFVNKPAFTQLLQVASDGSYEATVEVTSGANNIYFYSTNNFIGSIDNVSVIEITDDTDIPRIDYTDGTGALLLEPQSTNLITYSEDFSNSFWLIQNASVTLNNAISPDGTLSATKLIENTSNSTHKILNNAGLTVSGDVSMSIFAKKGERNWIRLTNNNIQGAYFDLENGIVGNVTTGIDAKIQSYGNGWYRCFISQLGVANERLGIYVSTDGVNTSYQGDGTSGVYIWGAQLEQKSFTTSYIPTEGSTVTRSADVANNSGNADLINSTEGVLYAEIAALADDGTSRRISLSNGSTSNTVEILLQNTGTVSFQVKSGNSFQGGGTFNLTQTEFNKIAVKYKANDLALWVNGSERSTDTSANTPIGLSELAFDDGGGGSDFYGKVKSVAVFKEALTDEELAQITSATQQEVFYEMRDKMLQINADYYEFGDYTTRLKKLF